MQCNVPNRPISCDDNLALLQKINLEWIEIDPFCGGATTGVVAARLNRQWIGVDRSAEAYKFVEDRLKKESITRWRPDTKIHIKTNPPQRTDFAVDHRERKLVYIISNPSDPDRQYNCELK